jgi:hypothetical protein
MYIKNIEELDNLFNKKWILFYKDNNIKVISLKTQKEILITDDLRDLQDFDFDIKLLEKISISVLEGICEEYRVNPTYNFKTGRWFGRTNTGELIDVSRLLRDNGYYL